MKNEKILPKKNDSESDADVLVRQIISVIIRDFGGNTSDFFRSIHPEAPTKPTPDRRQSRFADLLVKNS